MAITFQGIWPQHCLHQGHPQTVADAISQLNIGPVTDDKENWMLLSKFWNLYTTNTDEPVSTANHSQQMTCVFAKHTDKNAIYPLAVEEIADAQQKD